LGRYSNKTCRTLSGIAAQPEWRIVGTATTIIAERLGTTFPFLLLCATET
jgi:hypothetical protein